MPHLRSIQRPVTGCQGLGSVAAMYGHDPITCSNQLKALRFAEIDRCDVEIAMRSLL